jgi:hypothetical protein
MDIRELIITKEAGLIKVTQVGDVIFIFEKTVVETTFSLPNVNSGVCDHASIAASGKSTKRMNMIDIKFSVKGDHKPRLVIGEYRTGTVERFNVKGNCLSTRRCI